jgi:sigma-B regulation protein RsbQ
VTFLSDHRHDLARLRQPTLILQCSEDLIAPVAVGEYMKRQMPGSTLKLIRNVGHCPHLSSPGPTLDAIESFLASL